MDKANPAGMMAETDRRGCRFDTYAAKDYAPSPDWINYK